MVLVKVGQVPALCTAAAGQPEVRGQRGKGAVQFHFLHPLFTQLHALPLGWEHWLPIWDGPGLLLLRMHEGSPCQIGGDGALLSRSHIGGEGVWLNTW